jgi:peptide chain release factor 2
LTEITEIAISENDNSLESEILESLQELTNSIDQLELKTLFDEEFDARNVIVSIHAGAGGVESQDWAGMIMRMYLRWAEKNNMIAKVLETSKGDEAGIKSCTINIDGHNAFGMLRSEKGVHRLVRLSPYDSDNARHTSFVLVEILPEIESDIEIDIKSDDLNIESFKAGGAGGQSVQKNSTAIRITHIPTGIKVSCQNERSQVQNREIAMKILKSRLLSLEIKKRDENEKKLKGPHVSAEWGNQIRSYVLHPYKMVKDHRTNLESPDPDKILDGDLSEFIDKYLRMKKN